MADLSPTSEGLSQLTALAIASAESYHSAMFRWRLRQLSALLMALVLAVGLVMHGLGGPMVVKFAPAVASHLPSSGGEPMQGKCKGCAGDEKGVAPTACSAFCSAVATLPAAYVDPYAAPVETLVPTAGPGVIGWTHPPDPYPPKSTILS